MIDTTQYRKMMECNRLTELAGLYLFTGSEVPEKVFSLRDSQHNIIYTSVNLEVILGFLTGLLYEKAAADKEGCLGEHTYTSDAHDFDCEYENAPNCDCCLFGPPGGHIDPRMPECPECGRRVLWYNFLDGLDCCVHCAWSLGFMDVGRNTPSVVSTNSSGRNTPNPAKE